MQQLTSEQSATLRDWFLPDRPGPLVALHILGSGYGDLWVDQWPDPRVIYAECADNSALVGDPEAFALDDARAHMSGFVDAPQAFVPLLRTTFPDMVVWDRVIFELESEPEYSVPRGSTVRLLTPADTELLRGLSEEVNWVAKRGAASQGLQPAAPHLLRSSKGN